MFNLRQSNIGRVARRFWHWSRLVITTLKNRPTYPGEHDTYSYQKLYNDFDVRLGESVLDIGSGPYPFPLATVLADYYIEESPHRSGSLVRDDRPLVAADIHHLPFSDKSLDFVYCSHVLEHIEDPIKACSEITRVGKRGYIETPNFCKDALFSWAGEKEPEWRGHKWYVVRIANTLVFFEYTERQKRGIDSTSWYELIFAPYYHPLQEAFWKNHDIFNSMFMWEGSFNVFVFKMDGTVEGL